MYRNEWMVTSACQRRVLTEGCYAGNLNAQDSHASAFVQLNSAPWRHWGSVLSLQSEQRLFLGQGGLEQICRHEPQTLSLLITMGS